MKSGSLRILSGICLFAILGCGRPAPAPAPAETKPKRSIVGVCLANLDEPRQKQIKAEFESAAAKKSNWQLKILDAENDAAKQKDQIQQLAKEGVEAVIVDPVDAQSLVDPIAAIYQAEIPVVVIDRAIVGNDYSSHIAGDPRQIGETAGHWIAKKLDGKGIIVEIRGPVDSVWAGELHKAFRAALRDPGYRFVFDGYVDPPKVDAAKLMTEAMADVDSIDVVFAYDNAAAKSAYETAKAANRAEGVLFLGVGGPSGDGVEDVADGILAASFTNPTGTAEAIHAIDELLQGQRVSKRITPQSQVINKTTLTSPSALTPALDPGMLPTGMGQAEF